MARSPERAMARRIFGVDFSGAAKAGKLIWLAEAEAADGGLRILSCRPASELPGSASYRDSALAALRQFIASTPDSIFGCDFPFSLPAKLIAEPDWSSFLEAFTHKSAAAFRQHCRQRTGGSEPKRETDQESRTPWCAFNIRLQHQTFHGLSGLLRPLVQQGRVSILPMQKAVAGRPWLIETCPASLLIHLACRIPYKGRELCVQRAALVRSLVERGLLRSLPAAMSDIVIENSGGDALDSILAAIATAAALREIEAGRGGGHALEGRVFFRAT